MSNYIATVNTFITMCSTIILPSSPHPFRCYYPTRHQINNCTFYDTLSVKKFLDSPITKFVLQRSLPTLYTHKTNTIPKSMCHM